MACRAVTGARPLAVGMRDSRQSKSLDYTSISFLRLGPKEDSDPLTGLSDDELVVKR